MKTARKLLALLLALLMVVGAISMVACGGDKPDDGKKDDPAVDPVDPGKDPGTDPVDPGTDPVDPGTDPVDPGTDPVTPADPSEAETAKLNSLFEQYDFGGETLNMFVRDGDWYIEQEKVNDGDAVSMATYLRSSTVQDNLGVVFNVNNEYGDGQITQKLTNDVSSGTGEWDIVSGHMKFEASAALAGLCLNLNKLTNVDFTKDYWNQSYTDKSRDY